MHKTTEPRSFGGVDVGDFSDLGTAAATARMERDSDKRTLPSHSALRIQLNACIKLRKSRGFGGVNERDFQDQGTTVATARTGEDSDKHHLRT